MTDTEQRVGTMAVLAEVGAERRRQIKLGYDAAHDDQHTRGEILTAPWGAIARARVALDGTLRAGIRRQALIEAAALCIAEAERMDRSGGRDG